MRTMLRSLAGTMALVAAPVQACVTQQEMEGLVGYALPQLGQRLSDRCAPGLSAEGYMRSSLPRVIGELAARRDAYWPAARAAFAKIGAKGAADSETAKILATLPDEVLRPLIDQLFVDKLSEAIKPEACADVESVLETLDPLPAENTVRLLSVILGITARKDREIPSCPREPLTKAP